MSRSQNNGTPIMVLVISVVASFLPAWRAAHVSVRESLP